MDKIIEFTDLDGFEWQHYDAFIYWLFNGRCIVCNQSAEEINEIIPRSRSKHAVEDWRNRVSMCKKHHEEYHHDGVSDEKLKALQETRREYLIAIGRGRYV